MYFKSAGTYDVSQAHGSSYTSIADQVITARTSDSTASYALVSVQHECNQAQTRPLGGDCATDNLGESCGTAVTVQQCANACAAASATGCAFFSHNPSGASATDTGVCRGDKTGSSCVAVSLVSSIHYDTYKVIQTSRRISFLQSNSPSGASPGTAPHILHGSWYADNEVDTSDRRLKRNIRPLEIQLQKSREEAKGAAGTGDGKESAVSWVLRELRPVSFRFKSATDSKRLPRAQELRFGFVAQEVQRVAPDLVHDDGGSTTGGRTLALVYKDLMAVLTLAFKEQQQQLDRQDSDVLQAQEEVNELLEAAENLDRVLDIFEAQVADKRS